MWSRPVGKDKDSPIFNSKEKFITFVSIIIHTRQAARAYCVRATQSHRHNTTSIMPSLTRHITTSEVTRTIEAAQRLSRTMPTSDLPARLVPLIDHTTLSVTDSHESVRAFTADMLAKCRKAGVMPASVCTSPLFVESVGIELGDEPVAICSVAGCFPTGQTYPEVKMLECSMAMENGADEIDMVLDIGAVRMGRHDEASSEVRIIKEELDDDVTLKVIIETASFDSLDEIYNACVVALDGGADFVKSSTGKNLGGVTPEAAVAMCLAVKDHREASGHMAGVKFAGGISSPQDAMLYLAITETILGKEYVTPEFFRIGSSSLLDKLV